MSTLDVVAQVLREVAPRALCAKQVVELANGRLPTASRTPETVVSRDLAIDVKRHGTKSRFLRVGRGAFVFKEALPTAFYNDVDPYVAKWTRNLIEAGHLAPGVVDERSIRDLKPADVASYRQFHAFSGIGVWSRALRDAGWPDDVNVWSGSCPCQGWSSAGKRRGFADERHLWPSWFSLIRECRPAVLFTEQVASKDGRAWLDAVLDDLEGADYACQAYDLPACGVGAPHRRQRLYVVAYARERGREILGAPWLHLDGSGSSELGDARLDGVGEHRRELPRDEAQHAERASQGDHAPLTASAAYRPGDRVHVAGDPAWGGAVAGFWADHVEWIYCRPTPGYEDGCFRPAESGTQPLVDWSAQGMGRTRAKRLMGYGNAIVLPLATVFVESMIDALADAAHAIGVDAASVDAASVEAASVDAASVDAASVEAASVEVASVEVASVDAAPTEAPTTTVEPEEHAA